MTMTLILWLAALHGCQTQTPYLRAGYGTMCGQTVCISEGKRVYAFGSLTRMSRRANGIPFQPEGMPALSNRDPQDHMPILSGYVADAMPLVDGSRQIDAGWPTGYKTEPSSAHVRFTPADHIAILQRKIKNMEAYSEWESAARDIDWFGGKEKDRVGLSYVQDHMPRAVVFVTRFPADPRPPVSAPSLRRLLEAEMAYNATVNQAANVLLLEKYCPGATSAVLDHDEGGMTCGPQAAVLMLGSALNRDAGKKESEARAAIPAEGQAQG